MIFISGTVQWVRSGCRFMCNFQHYPYITLDLPFSSIWLVDQYSLTVNTRRTFRKANDALWNEALLSAVCNLPRLKLIKISSIFFSDHVSVCRGGVRKLSEHSVILVTSAAAGTSTPVNQIHLHV